MEPEHAEQRGPKHFRHEFPTDFVFGAATSAFQIEGAVNEDGRGKTGRRSHGVNEKGIAFYNVLIDDLIANGITPYVTLFHWDLPQYLEDEYSGFLNHKIVEDFRGYADLCFEKFGDRVKHWITLNEPWTYSFYGYGLGTLAPGRGHTSNFKMSYLMDFIPSSRYVSPQSFMRKRTVTTTFGGLGKAVSDKEGGNTTEDSGNPGTEPYIVSHHQLLAHAEAVKLYRDKYQKTQNGKIGITLVSRWFMARTHSTSDRNAAERAIDFMFLDPVTSGQYPRSMRSIVKERLPKFTEAESKMLKGSFDFIGLNYYTTNYAAHAPDVDTLNPHVATDRMGGSSWLFVYPKGFMDLLLYIKTKYNNPSIYVTENGIDEKTDATLPLWESLSDHKRVSYHHHHLCFLKKATREYGINVRGYFTWSLLDNFEWASGVFVRFGNIYVDYKDKCKRYPKLSAEWFKLHLPKIEPRKSDVDGPDS
ncbi:hypothetical protein RJ639_046564, partial [Escallonia herrerae]